MGIEHWTKITFQFAFRLNLSTNNFLTSITDNIQNKVDNGEFTTTIYVDFKKVFDRGILVE